MHILHFARTTRRMSNRWQPLTLTLCHLDAIVDALYMCIYIFKNLLLLIFMKVEKFFGYLFNMRTPTWSPALKPPKAERTSQNGVWTSVCINFYHHVQIFTNIAGNGH